MVPKGARRRKSQEKRGESGKERRARRREKGRMEAPLTHGYVLERSRESGA